MLTTTFLALAVLWMVALRRYPSLFVSRTATGINRPGHHLGENWIEVIPATNHHELVSMQEAV